VYRGAPWRKENKALCQWVALPEGPVDLAAICEVQIGVCPQSGKSIYGITGMASARQMPIWALPDNTHLHHVDGNPLNAAPCNIVAMFSQEHHALHSRKRKD